ncbi:hypothetical protein [Blastopirellula marina]|uniref:Neutral/alkaline non-lysosomal ceramidase N-terminal domain-containing protein n=1 Tax=Blastopirellula marina TaxID=124 RepID=A0A2S8G8S7_9BACT|nr:hypothetical protein [Blastopirellula marina]PQO40710.1 hypothetical protein C5Y98_05685 [Blastopirellula marina]PTL45670.1 hypothetical protein C5Y97_05685 [Blastopirellula marina]
MNLVRSFRTLMGVALVAVSLSSANTLFAEPLKLATFAVDASPPIGSPLAYDPTKGIQEPLTLKGVILKGNQTVVLCALDWIGVANGSQDVFKEAIAKAVGTKPELVMLHTLHQHDAPEADATTHEVLEEFGLPAEKRFDRKFVAEVVARAADAAKQATGSWQKVTHIGLGEGIIEKVASNRRILGEDGKVKYTRYTATKDPVIRAQPTGTIDPLCKSISFYNEDKPLAVLTYYATHPQSYYRTGMANPDFPGMARNSRQEKTGVFHMHFNGAGGNIGAGKWNDGAHENRQVLADRVESGMTLALTATEKFPIDAADMEMTSVDVQLPPAPHLQKEGLLSILRDEKSSEQARWQAARELVWLRRCEAGDTIALSCLKLGKARIIHMPGELFVEYQLAAQKMRPDLFVAMAAYGDYAPGYIGTEIAYSQGGYETSQMASRVSSRVEQVLMSGLQKLLDAQ